LALAGLRCLLTELETLVARLALVLLFLHTAAAVVLGQQLLALHMVAVVAGNFLLVAAQQPLMDLLFLFTLPFPAHLT